MSKHASMASNDSRDIQVKHTHIRPALCGSLSGPFVKGISMSFSRLTALILALAAGFAMVAADVADARVGGGRSFGSRASRTYTAPPATNTAPKAAPIERSMTQKGAPTSTQPAPLAQPSRFGGWRGVLMGGSVRRRPREHLRIRRIGQCARLSPTVCAYCRRRLPRRDVHKEPQPAGRLRAPLHDRALTGHRGVIRLRRVPKRSAPLAAALRLQRRSRSARVTSIHSRRLLGEIQTAYGREDTEKLGALTTPEMLSYLSQELSDNAKQGLRNEVSDVKLLQGDLSEAWRDHGSDYATVAMRYSLIDATVDRATGRIVSGDRTRSTEAIELWTFRRDDRARADGWQLSAIQQAA